jgi:hypothetical protein
VTFGEVTGFVILFYADMMMTVFVILFYVDMMMTVFVIGCPYYGNFIAWK